MTKKKDPSNDLARHLLSDNLRKYRELRGWSQQKLAEESDIGLSFIAAIETRKKFPSSTTLDSLAKAFNIQVHELFYEPDTRDKQFTSLKQLSLLRQNLTKAILEDIEASFDEHIK